MAIKNTVEFSVDIVGELTNKSYVGSFIAKTKLSMRETLRQDEIRRGVVGVNSQEASDDTKVIASVIAYLTTHIISSPEWWKALNNGLDAEDMNVLIDVNNKCQEAIENEYKALKDEAKVAEEELKKSTTAG